MKVTGHLLDWLQAQFRERFESYSELSRVTKGKPTYQAWGDLLQGDTSEIRSDMEDAICQAFNVSPIELAAIAHGVVRENHPRYGTDAEKALALWRWVGYQQQRKDMIRAMGYEGDLPDDVHKKEKKKS